MLSIEKIVSLCKQRGIVFPGSEIIGLKSWDTAHGVAGRSFACF